MKGSLLLYNLKLNCLIIFFRSKQLTDYIYTDIGIQYCKLSKCIGQTSRSYERYLGLSPAISAQFTLVKLVAA